MKRGYSRNKFPQSCGPVRITCLERYEDVGDERNYKYQYKNGKKAIGKHD